MYYDPLWTFSDLFALTSFGYWAVQWSWFAWVNALCNFSCKKSREVTASLPGRFLSKCCFTLCITMEVEPRIVKQYKCHHCCSYKNYLGKWMEGGKSVFALFFGWPEDCEFVEKMHFGASYWAIKAGLLTPLTFAWHRLSPLAAFISGAYFLHNGRWWQWICEFYTANFKGIFGGP